MSGSNPRVWRVLVGDVQAERIVLNHLRTNEHMRALLIAVAEDKLDHSLKDQAVAMNVWIERNVRM